MKTPLFYFHQWMWIMGVYLSVQMVCAQSSQTYDQNYRKATTLFEAQNYRTAQRFFQKCQHHAPHPTAYRQALAFAIICDKQLNNKVFVSQAESFLTQFPSSEVANQVRFHIGDYYFQQGKYQLTTAYLTEISLTNPQTTLEIEATYKLAYSLFALRKYDEAYNFFSLIKQKNHAYQDASWYYSGYIRYLNKEYEGAARELRHVKETFENQQEVHQLIAHLLFLNQEYERSIGYIQNIIDQYPDDPNLNTTLNIILGNSYYALQKYAEALPFLKAKLETDTKNVNLLFQVGMCLLKAQKALEATEYLRFATELAPENVQIWYHYGVACAKIEDKKYLILAQEAFKNCRKPAEYAHLHELGALNYAMVSHKLEDYQSVSEGCSFYRLHYPKGEFLNDVEQLMLKASMQGDDYFGAADYLQKIKAKTPEIKRAYQRVLFNKAVTLLERQNVEEASRIFHQSLEYPFDEELIHQAHYWLAEMDLQKANYRQALTYYFRIPADTPAYVKSLYGIGYAYFQLSQYQKAQLFFEDFLKLESSKNPRQHFEVQGRIADCEFATKNYRKALQAYDKLLEAHEIKAHEQGYFLLQKGLILNQLQQFLEAIPLFDEVIATSSEQKYSDYAYWHQAEAYEQLLSYHQAIKPLNYLVLKAHHQAIKPMALFKRGKIYLKTDEMMNAVDDFRRIIYQYPTHKTATKALKKLEKLQESGEFTLNVEELVQYVGKQNPEFLNVQVEEIQKLNRQKKYHLVIGQSEKFLTRFPRSTSVHQVRYEMGKAFWGLNDKENALKTLRQVRGDYQVKAQQKMHQIYDQKQAKKPVREAVEKSKNIFAQIDKFIQNNDFSNAKKQLHKYYHQDDIQGEKSVFYTMKVMIEEKNWSSVEATFYEFKRRFPKSRKYYDAVLMLAESKMHTGRKTEAKGLIQEVLEHSRNRNTIIKAKALLYQM